MENEHEDTKKMINDFGEYLKCINGLSQFLINDNSCNIINSIRECGYNVVEIEVSMDAIRSNSE